MKKIVRFTESDLTRLVKRVINENSMKYLKKLSEKIIMSKKFDEVLNEMNPDDFGDEFEYADNFITNLLEEFSGYKHYDDLYDYIKDEYGEMIISYYFNDDDDDDDL